MIINTLAMQFNTVITFWFYNVTLPVWNLGQHHALLTLSRAVRRSQINEFNLLNYFKVKRCIRYSTVYDIINSSTYLLCSSAVQWVQQWQCCIWSLITSKTDRWTPHLSCMVATMLCGQVSRCTLPLMWTGKTTQAEVMWDYTIIVIL